MSSRNTIDTNFLRIREVFAFNPLNNDFIKSESIPVIGNSGRLKYYSTLDFLSSISVPTASTNVLNLLTSIQPGFSTLSTIIQNPAAYASTVGGLGTAGYVSTSYLKHEIDELSYTYKYISATTLLDCIKNLGDLQQIGNQFGPMVIGTNLDGGYVSTFNPGEYRIYKSTLPALNILPFAYDSNYMNNNTTLPICEIDIGGFQNHIVNTSKMTIDIQLNTNVFYTNGLQYNATMSTVLTPYDDPSSEIQSDILTIPAYFSNATLGTSKFLLNSNDLTPFPNKIRLYFKQYNLENEGCFITTLIPQKNGVYITLDNTD
jgi:hypothetical protein